LAQCRRRHLVCQRGITWAISQITPGTLLHCWSQPDIGGITELANEHITVTGTVPDVRPYIQHAAVVVAPLRIARGIQNKILEAMAMERPVIASTDCAAAVDAVLGQELLTANTPDDYLQAINTCLENPEKSTTIGQAARQRVIERYSWKAHMSGIDRYISSSPAEHK
jgi:glycosyltransferase involved in cell wall biosynthesis